MRSILFCLVLAGVFAFSTVARADLFVVNDGGPHDSDTVVFVIPAGLAPTSYVLGSSVTYDLMVIFDGVSQPDEVTFFHTTGNSPSFHDDLSRNPVITQQLYTGPESSPTFLTGYFAGPRDVDGDVTITPEPASIALLGTGMIGALGLWRRRRAS